MYGDDRRRGDREWCTGVRAAGVAQRSRHPRGARPDPLAPVSRSGHGWPRYWRDSERPGQYRGTDWYDRRGWWTAVLYRADLVRDHPVAGSQHLVQRLSVAGGGDGARWLSAAPVRSSRFATGVLQRHRRPGSARGDPRGGLWRPDPRADSTVRGWRVFVFHAVAVGDGAPLAARTRLEVAAQTRHQRTWRVHHRRRDAYRGRLEIYRRRLAGGGVDQRAGLGVPGDSRALRRTSARV